MPGYPLNSPLTSLKMPAASLTSKTSLESYARANGLRIDSLKKISSVRDDCAPIFDSYEYPTMETPLVTHVDFRNLTFNTGDDINQLLAGALKDLRDLEHLIREDSSIDEKLDRDKILNLFMHLKPNQKTRVDVWQRRPMNPIELDGLKNLHAIFGGRLVDPTNDRRVYKTGDVLPFTGGDKMGKDYDVALTLGEGECKITYIKLAHILEYKERIVTLQNMGFENVNEYLEELWRCRYNSHDQDIRGSNIGQTVEMRGHLHTLVYNDRYMDIVTAFPMSEGPWMKPGVFGLPRPLLSKSLDLAKGDRSEAEVSMSGIDVTTLTALPVGKVETASLIADEPSRQQAAVENLNIPSNEANPKALNPSPPSLGKEKGQENEESTNICNSLMRRLFGFPLHQSDEAIASVEMANVQSGEESTQDRAPLSAVGDTDTKGEGNKKKSESRTTSTLDPNAKAFVPSWAVKPKTA